jgi:protein-S-isoprenylcysteine O-methyltransferase Ste14
MTPSLESAPRRPLGETFFKWRSYWPVLLVPFLVPLGPWDGRPVPASIPWKIGCLLLSLAGLALRCFAVGYSAPGTSGRCTRQREAAELNTTGAYSLLRHPLYVANILMALGLGLFTQTLVLPLVTLLLATLFFVPIARWEEDFLRSRFGAAFEAWAARVPRFRPAVGRYRRPDRAFEWRRVLRREFYGLAAILIVPLGLDLLQVFALTGSLRVEPIWGWTAAAGVVAFVGLRALKKRRRRTAS